MLNRIRIVLIAAVLCACSTLPAFAQALQTAPQTTAAEAHTAKIVEAANAFIGSLSAAQKTAALFAFTDSSQRVRWSNLPQGTFTRKGVARGELNEAQRSALTNLLATVLSPRGLKMVSEQMAADDVLRAAAGGRGPGFGSDFYYVSFLGTPSTTSPWMMQFGGHHLAINATIVGANVTLSPSLTGGQPVKFTANGQPIYIVEDELSRVGELMGSLTDEQRRVAIVSSQRIDLVLGPGQDGKVLQPEGLAGGKMTDAQKARFLELIKTWLGILNADHVAAKIAAVQQSLDSTYFAWFGPAGDAGASYFRVSGPQVLLEFSPQQLGGDPKNHLHNMYRDPTNEYGAAWTSLK